MKEPFIHPRSTKEPFIEINNVAGHADEASPPINPAWNAVPLLLPLTSLSVD